MSVCLSVCLSVWKPSISWHLPAPPVAPPTARAGDRWVHTSQRIEENCGTCRLCISHLKRWLSHRHSNSPTPNPYLHRPIHRQNQILAIWGKGSFSTTSLRLGVNLLWRGYVLSASHLEPGFAKQGWKVFVKLGSFWAHHLITNIGKRWDFCL